MENVSENDLRAFGSLAHVIERKLFEIQIALVAHKQPLRFVHIEYLPSLSEEETARIEENINHIYDLLQKYCDDYHIPKEKANLKNELYIKVNFLWEDMTGATAKHLKGYGETEQELKEDYNQKIEEMVQAVNDLIHQFK